MEFGVGELVVVKQTVTWAEDLHGLVGEVIVAGGLLFDYLVYFAGGLELHLDEHELEKYVPPTDKD